jgi:Ca2+-binding RTX toxin-like protein
MNFNKRKNISFHTLLLIFASMLAVILTASSAAITTVWADELIGTQGDDQILGTEGDDTILGLGGVDIIAGQGGNDILDGGNGNDNQVSGEQGDDIIDGGRGDDQGLFGGEGNDRISGGAGNDVLQGNEGDDTLLGGNGDDSMFGGPGADEFVCGRGVDAVFDYNAEEGDTKSSDCEQVGFIRLIKAFGGTQQTPHDKGDFGVEITGNNPVPPETGFTIAAVLPGQYSVHEVGESGGTLTLGEFVYEVTYSEGCSGTISAGETKVCTVTNSLN